MCDYSVAAVPRDGTARKDEELTLVNFADHMPGHVVRGFASPMNLRMPVCMLPGTKLRYLGLTSHPVPTEGVAEFVQTHLDDPHTTHDALRFDGNRIVKLSHLAPGMQVRVIEVPAEVQRRQRLVETTTHRRVTEFPSPREVPVSAGA